MGNRPGQLANLEKGKFIGGQENFVDTFNWMKDCLNNMTGSNGITVEGIEQGSPVIRPATKDEVDGSASSGTLGSGGSTATTIIGTDGSSAESSGGSITFEQMDNTNVKVLVEGNGSDVKIKIGAYWYEGDED